MHILRLDFLKTLLWKGILHFCMFSMFMLIGILAWGFVYDCEPLDPVKEYQLDKECFDRNNDNWFNDFPSFGDWLNQQEAKEDKFREWLKNINQEFGYQCAETFDPWYQRPYYQDPRESYAAQAPNHDQNDHDFGGNN